MKKGCEDKSLLSGIRISGHASQTFRREVLKNSMKKRCFIRKPHTFFQAASWKHSRTPGRCGYQNPRPL